jgi:hypothetical protein
MNKSLITTRFIEIVEDKRTGYGWSRLSTPGSIRIPVQDLGDQFPISTAFSLGQCLLGGDSAISTAFPKSTPSDIYLPEQKLSDARVHFRPSFRPPGHYLARTQDKVEGW